MTTAHNHPPRCCCPSTVGVPAREHSAINSCPLCPEHGDLAQLADEPQPGECPLCHQPIGREHTDYCRFTGPVTILARAAGPFRTTTNQPTTQARDTDDPWQAPLSGIEVRNPPRTPGYDGPEGTEWPRSPIQWHQDGPDDAHERWQCSRDTCGIAPIPRDDNPR